MAPCIGEFIGHLIEILPQLSGTVLEKYATQAPVA
jgi:hypothetical protein